MTLLESIILGIVQGVTEFLPISSSGHLLLFKNIFNLRVSNLLDVILHFGTLVVVLFVFRERIIKIIKALFKFLKRDKLDSEDLYQLKIFNAVILATLITTIPALFLADSSVFDMPLIAYLCFLITAVFLLIVSRIALKDGKITYKKAIIIGIAQSFGILPGISRSGITIGTALVLGVNRKEAGEFSFLLFIPASLGAMILKFDSLGQLLSQVSIDKIAISFIVSIIFGFLSISLLLKFVRSGKLHYFSYYLLIVGIVGVYFYLTDSLNL